MKRTFCDCCGKQIERIRTIEIVDFDVCDFSSVRRHYDICGDCLKKVKAVLIES